MEIVPQVSFVGIYRLHFQTPLFFKISYYYSIDVPSLLRRQQHLVRSLEIDLILQSVLIRTHQGIKNPACIKYGKF